MKSGQATALAKALKRYDKRFETKGRFALSGARIFVIASTGTKSRKYLLCT